MAPSIGAKNPQTSSSTNSQQSKRIAFAPGSLISSAIRRPSSSFVSNEPSTPYLSPSSTSRSNFATSPSSSSHSIITPTTPAHTQSSSGIPSFRALRSLLPFGPSKNNNPTPFPVPFPAPASNLNASIGATPTPVTPSSSSRGPFSGFGNVRRSMQRDRGGNDSVKSAFEVGRRMSMSVVAGSIKENDVKDIPVIAIDRQPGGELRQVTFVGEPEPVIRKSSSLSRLETNSMASPSHHTAHSTRSGADLLGDIAVLAKGLPSLRTPSPGPPLLMDHELSTIIEADSSGISLTKHLPSASTSFLVPTYPEPSHVLPSSNLSHASRSYVLPSRQPSPLVAQASLSHNGDPNDLFAEGDTSALDLSTSHLDAQVLDALQNAHNNSGDAWLIPSSEPVIVDAEDGESENGHALQEDVTNTIRPLDMNDVDAGIDPSINFGDADPDLAELLSPHRLVTPSLRGSRAGSRENSRPTSLVNEQPPKSSSQISLSLSQHTGALPQPSINDLSPARNPPSTSLPPSTNPMTHQISTSTIHTFPANSQAPTQAQPETSAPINSSLMIGLSLSTTNLVTPSIIRSRKPPATLIPSSLPRPKPNAISTPPRLFPSSISTSNRIHSSSHLPVPSTPASPMTALFPVRHARTRLVTPPTSTMTSSPVVTPDGTISTMSNSPRTPIRPTFMGLEGNLGRKSSDPGSIFTGDKMSRESSTSGSGSGSGSLTAHSANAATVNGKKFGFTGAPANEVKSATTAVGSVTELGELAGQSADATITSSTTPATVTPNTRPAVPSTPQTTIRTVSSSTSGSISSRSHAGRPSIDSIMRDRGMSFGYHSRPSTGGTSTNTSPVRGSLMEPAVITRGPSSSSGASPTDSSSVTTPQSTLRSGRSSAAAVISRARKRSMSMQEKLAASVGSETPRPGRFYERDRDRLGSRLDLANYAPPSRAGSWSRDGEPDQHQDGMMSEFGEFSPSALTTPSNVDSLGPRTVKVFKAAGLLDSEREKGRERAGSGSMSVSGPSLLGRFSSMRGTASEYNGGMAGSRAQSRMAFSEIGGFTTRSHGHSRNHSGSVAGGGGVTDSPTYTVSSGSRSRLGDRDRETLRSASTAPTSISGGSYGFFGRDRDVDRYRDRDKERDKGSDRGKDKEKGGKEKDKERSKSRESEEIDSLKEKHQLETGALLGALSDSQRTSKMLREENSELRDRFGKAMEVLEKENEKLRKQVEELRGEMEGLRKSATKSRYPGSSLSPVQVTLNRDWDRDFLKPLPPFLRTRSHSPEDNAYVRDGRFDTVTPRARPEISRRPSYAFGESVEGLKNTRPLPSTFLPSSRGSERRNQDQIQSRQPSEVGNGPDDHYHVQDHDHDHHDLIDANREDDDHLSPNPNDIEDPDLSTKLDPHRRLSTNSSISIFPIPPSNMTMLMNESPNASLSDSFLLQTQQTQSSLKPATTNGTNNGGPSHRYHPLPRHRQNDTTSSIDLDGFAVGSFESLDRMDPATAMNNSGDKPRNSNGSIDIPHAHTINKSRKSNTSNASFGSDGNGRDVSPTTGNFSILTGSPGSLFLKPEHEMHLGDMDSFSLDLGYRDDDSQDAREGQQEVSVDDRVTNGWDR